MQPVLPWPTEVVSLGSVGLRPVLRELHSALLLPLVACCVPPRWQVAVLLVVARSAVPGCGRGWLR